MTFNRFSLLKTTSLKLLQPILNFTPCAPTINRWWIMNRGKIHSKFNNFNDKNGKQIWGDKRNHTIALILIINSLLNWHIFGEQSTYVCRYVPCGTVCSSTTYKVNKLETAINIFLNYRYQCNYSIIIPVQGEFLSFKKKRNYWCTFIYYREREILWHILCVRCKLDQYLQ